MPREITCPECYGSLVDEPWRCEECSYEIHGYLDFHPSLVEKIRMKWKYSTLRYAMEREFVPGKPVELTCDSETFALATVDWTGIVTPAGFIRMDFDGHERYASVEDLLETFDEYYPDGNIAEDTLLDFIVWDPGSLVKL